MINLKNMRVFKTALKALGSDVRATCKPFEKNKQNFERKERYPNVNISHLGIEVTNFHYF